MVFTHHLISAVLNRQLRKLVLGLTLALVIQLVPSASAEPNSSPSPASQISPRKILSGWIPYYGMSTSLPTALANSDLINEVMPFWYTFKLDSKTKAPYILDLYTPGNPSVAIDVPLSTMRNAGFKIIPTITDGTEKLELAKFLAESSDRANAIKAIVALVINNKFDGIDLDFEGFAFVDGTDTWPTTKPNWVLFVKELSSALHAQGKLLSITAPVHFALTEKQKGYTVYAWAEIAQYIDRLRIMTYDYSTGKPGPIGPIDWVERTVKYAVSVMPASKVYIGLAGYGRDWVTKVDGICPDNVSKVVATTAKAATFIMRNAVTLASTYGVVPIYNEQYQEATFTYQKTYNGNNVSGQPTSCTATRTAWYQNPTSYLVRAQLVAKYRLGGVAEWTMGMEEQSATDAIRSTALTIAPDEVILSLSTDQSEVKYGSTINLSSQATLKDKSSLPGFVLALEFKGFDETSWRSIGKVVTADTGLVTTPLYLAKSGKLRITSEGSWDRSTGLSSEVPITINPRLNISAPTSAKAGTAFKVFVTAAPTTIRSQVALRRFDGKAWNTVSLAPLLAAGTEVSQIEPIRGVYNYQILVFDSSESAESTSAPFSVIVR